MVTDLKRNIAIILVLILVIAAVVLSYFNYFQKLFPKLPPAPVPEKREVAEKEIITPPTKIDVLCGEFPVIQDEITCESAIELALKNYSGEAEYVSRVVLPEEETLIEVGVKLKEATVLENLAQKVERVKIIINTKTSEIISVRPGREL